MTAVAAAPRLELLEVTDYSASPAPGIVTVIRANEPDPEPVECPVAGGFVPTVGGRCWVETGSGSWVAVAPELAAAAPAIPDSYPRGMLRRGTQSTDIVLDPNVGGELTLVGASAVPVLAGRRYKVTLAGAHSLITTGSTFAATDYWEFWLEREVNASGAWNEFPGTSVPGHVRLRANVAIAARWPLPVVIGFYEPSASADVAFRARGSKGSGSVNVGMTVGTNTGASPISLTVEDVGLA